MNYEHAEAVAPAKYSITGAKLGDAGRLGRVFADAFQNDPVMQWILPNQETVARFFEFELAFQYAPLEHSDLLEGDLGAAVWAPPHFQLKRPPTLRSLQFFSRMLLAHGLQPMKKAQILDQAFKQHRPNYPHWYLHTLGARLSAQGRGVGSSLLRHGLTRVDNDGLPAYLESSNPRNVSLYERHGFEVQAELPLGGDGPLVSYMLRPAQSVR